MYLKKYFMKSVNRISKDFKQKELLPLKLVFFVQASTISVLYPYLTIHMRELGINVEEAAIMSAVIPVIGIIMPPLAGMVADKIGNFKLLLAFFSLMGGAAALLLLLVPVGRITVTYPERLTLDLGCGETLKGNQSDVTTGVFQMGLSSDIFCDQVPGLRDSNSTRFNLNFTKFEGCGFVCRNLNDTQNSERVAFQWEEFGSGTPFGDVVLTGRSYAVQMKAGEETKFHHYNLAKEDVPKAQTKADILSHRIMENEGHLTTSIRRLAPSRYFFPALDFVKLVCKKSPSKTREKREKEENDFVCHMVMDEDVVGSENLVSSPRTNMSFHLRRQHQEDGSEGLNQFTSDFADWFAGNRSEKVKVTCAKSQGTDVSVSVFLHNPENNLEVVKTLPLFECEPRCLLTVPRKSICTNLNEEVHYDPQFTFWTYLAIRVFIGIIGSTSYAMYEVAVISILREQKADYGLQRIYASIGGMISSPLSGMLIDYASQGKGYTDFRPAFYLYAGLKASTSLLLLFINLEFKKAATNVISDAIQVLKNLEVIALLMVCFVFGTAWGYIESFLFWFLEDLGGTRSLMGITITVGGIAGIPLLVLSGPIIDKIGHANVLFIGFLFYAIRLVGYSVIYNPYHCLFFEALESITSSLAITAAVTYAAKLSTTTTDGSIQGLVGGLYFGVGRGSGSLIGGYLMKAFGTRQTYQIFAVFSVISGFAYYFFNQFYMAKRPRVEGNEICAKEPKPEKNNDSNVLIITQKPPDKRYGSIQPENNSAEGGTSPERKEKEEQTKDDQLEKSTESHSNPAYVPDLDDSKDKNFDSSKDPVSGISR